MRICSQCKKTQVGTEKYCANCGNPITLEPKTKVKRIVVTGIIAGAILFVTKKIISLAMVTVIICVCLFSESAIESEANRYIREIKKIDNVKEISAVVCISSTTYGEDENTLGYVILYRTEKTSDFAYFEEGIYFGNGFNGGDALVRGGDKEIYNIRAFVALADALEFILSEDIPSKSFKKYYEVDKGVVYIAVIDVAEWVDGFTY
ncbi:MAG: hypothetical protein IKZ19_08970 [Clostridia bacterium]|nr:hypothetical protein [Clostridia bacterium]